MFLGPLSPRWSLEFLGLYSASILLSVRLRVRSWLRSLAEMFSFMSKGMVLHFNFIISYPLNPH